MSSSPPWPISFDLWLGEGRQATDAEGTQSSNSVMVSALAAQRLKHSKFKDLQKFRPRIKWSPQTFEELQKAQFD